MLENVGLAEFEDHPYKIIETALFVFGRNDGDFEKRRTLLTARYQEGIDKMVQQDKDIETFIEEFGNDALEDATAVFERSSNEKV